ncbi:hypothetical protein K443DRAFT_675894 [Laccaria amethystina LaAM-08-1]|uniref:Uncharacterized protein n=1 Tax=Laccaria amethystina LaAM-08-1 TaxID=1095629 RepID=A0A0C9XRY0_9AGAR|nr:hypothetical protein K443DRAFT_675894 [Laccaria amethystina LaAM-08-1]
MLTQEASSINQHPIDMPPEIFLLCLEDYDTDSVRLPCRAKASGSAIVALSS